MYLRVTQQKRQRPVAPAFLQTRRTLVPAFGRTYCPTDIFSSIDRSESFFDCEDLRMAAFCSGVIASNFAFASARSDFAFIAASPVSAASAAALLSPSCATISSAVSSDTFLSRIALRVAAFCSGVIASNFDLAASRSAFSFAVSTGIGGVLSSANADTEANANAPAKRAAISFLFIDVSSEKCRCVREAIRASTWSVTVRPLFSFAIWVKESNGGILRATLRPEQAYRLFAFAPPFRLGRLHRAPDLRRRHPRCCDYLRVFRRPFLHPDASLMRKGPEPGSREFTKLNDYIGICCRLQRDRGADTASLRSYLVALFASLRRVGLHRRGIGLHGRGVSLHRRARLHRCRIGLGRRRGLRGIGLHRVGFRLGRLVLLRLRFLGRGLGHFCFGRRGGGRLGCRRRRRRDCHRGGRRGRGNAHP